MSLSLLNAAPQAVVDTVVAVAARDSLSVAVDVAMLLMALGVAALAVLLAMVMRRVDRAISDVRRSVGRHMGPVSDRAKSISDNVEFITDALRTDVQRLNASVKALSNRLQQASDHMEERIEEFNALMELVQSEAEEIFLDTAATVRGVREGARTMASGDGRRRNGPSAPDHAEIAVPRGGATEEAASSTPEPDDGPDPDAAGEERATRAVSPAADRR